MARRERDILEHAIHSISEQAAKADRWCDPMNLSADSVNVSTASGRLAVLLPYSKRASVIGEM